MRDELHLMELVDRYLDGEMGEAERTAFEQRANDNADLRELVNAQRALREGLHRIQLRHAVVSAHRAWTINRWWPWIAGGLVVIAAGVWWLRPLSEHELSEKPPVVVSDTLTTAGDEAAPCDSLMYGVGSRTLVESVFTSVRTPAEGVLDTSGGRVITRLITQESAAGTKAEQTEQRSTSMPDAAEPIDAPRGSRWGAADLAIASTKGDSLAASFTGSVQMKTLLARIYPPDSGATHPCFPGGMDEMQRFVADNLRQPRGSKRTGIVTIRFTVNKKGEVVDPEVVGSLARAFDAEALRVIGLMPAWTPCMMGDRPVKCDVEVPVRFLGRPATRGSNEVVK